MAGIGRYAAPLALTVFCCALVLAPAPAAFATYAGANGEVIFQSSRDGDNEIYLLNGDGSGVTQLTTNTAADVNPVWSPDGQKIVFQSNRSGNADVWVMDADGANPVQLTNDSTFDGSPTWSPDGARIAFTSSRDGDDEIFAMDADGSDEVQLTVNGATDEDPAWGWVPLCTPSCTGTIGRIAFTSDRDGNDEIYAMSDDGSGQTNLTANPAADTEASWFLFTAGNGGGRIAFVSDRGHAPGDSDLDVWEMGSNGFAPSWITDDPVDEVAPAYSPDGLRIAYERVGADREIYVANSSGQNSVNITNASSNERAPDWQAVPNTNFPYPRPKGATPMRLSLVVAYPECTSPNRTHGPPLAFPSCAPPVPSSANVNVGNPLPDLSGAAANMMGAVRYDVLTGAPGPPDDSDVSISASIVDVRCEIRNTGTPTFPCGSPNSLQQNDYVGELEASVAITITDRWNATVPPGGGDNATGSEFAQEVTIPCQATASNTTGGRCSVSTSLNTLAPGSVRDGKRAVWALGQVKVYDAGPDGTVANDDGRAVFAIQGVMVP